MHTFYIIMLKCNLYERWTYRRMRIFRWTCMYVICEINAINRLGRYSAFMDPIFGSVIVIIEPSWSMSRRVVLVSLKLLRASVHLRKDKPLSLRYVYEMSTTISIVKKSCYPAAKHKIFHARKLFLTKIKLTKCIN